MAARKKDLRPPELAPHVVDVGADALAQTIGLARQQLVAAHHPFGAAEIDRDVAVLDALDQAAHDLADAVLVLLVLALAFGLSHLLDDHLLCGLGRDAAEVDGGQRLGQDVAGLGVGVALARLAKRDLLGFVLHLGTHLEAAEDADVTILRVDLGPDLMLHPVFRARRLLDRLLHGGDHRIALDAFLTRHRVRDLQELESVVAGRGLRFHGHERPPVAMRFPA